MKIEIAPTPPAPIRVDRIEWSDRFGVVGVNPQDWAERIMREAFWLADMVLIATSLTYPSGTLVLEPLLLILQRHYLLGITALTWPTHDQPDLRDAGINDIGYVPARWD